MRNLEEKGIKNEYIDKLLCSPTPGWVNYPRYINKLYAQGDLNSTSYVVYMHLRGECDMYGICRTSVVYIQQALFKQSKMTDDYINKILRKLKSLRLIWYETRNGCRGNFNIYFGDFFLPDSKITSLAEYFDGDKVPTDVTALEEVSTYLVDPSLRLVEESPPMIKANQLAEDVPPILGENNNTNNNISNTVMVSNKGEGYKAKILTSGFTPKNPEEARALVVAKSLGVTHLDYYLSLIKKGKYWVIEKAYGEYKEDALNKKIKSPPSYVGGIIKRMLKEKVSSLANVEGL